MNRARVTDLAVAIGIGGLLAESPFTPDDTGPSIAIGTVAALLVLWYRSTRPEQSLPDTAKQITGGFVRRLLRVPVLVWLCLAVWLAIFTPTLRWMYSQWTGSFWHNNHSLIIAVLMGLLTAATLRREARRGTPYDVSAWGFALVLAGVGLAVLDAGTRTHQVASIGLVLSLPGLVLLLLGKRRLRALALPLSMGVFLVPLPSLIANHLYLRSITAQWTHWLLQSLGLRASLYHAQIELSNHLFNVSEACSGFSTLVAAIALSLFLISLCRSPARRTAVLLAIVPLTLAANTVRVVLLVFLTLSFGSEILDTAVHEASGVATFVIVIGGLFVIADRPSVIEAFR